MRSRGRRGGGGHLDCEGPTGLASLPLPLLPPSFLDVSELLSVAGRLRRDTDMEEARAMLTNMDVDHDGRVDLTEYTQLLEQLVSVP